MLVIYNHKALKQTQTSADGKLIVCHFFNALERHHKTKAFSTQVVTNEQLEAWVNGQSIQDAMPHLPVSDRELFLTGVDSEEWDKMWEQSDAKD